MAPISLPPPLLQVAMKRKATILPRMRVVNWIDRSFGTRSCLAFLLFASIISISIIIFANWQWIIMNCTELHWLTDWLNERHLTPVSAAALAAVITCVIEKRRGRGWKNCRCSLFAFWFCWFWFWFFQCSENEGRNVFLFLLLLFLLA